MTINSTGASAPVTAAPYRPGAQPQVYTPIPNDYPADGSAITIIPPTTSAQIPTQVGSPQTPPAATVPGTISGLATQAANQMELFRENFAASIGAWRNRDGSYDFPGTRKPNANERQMLDSLQYMVKDAKEVAQSGDAQARRNGVTRLRDDFQVAAQTWTRIPASPELNSRWQSIQQSLQGLINAAYR